MGFQAEPGKMCPLQIRQNMGKAAFGCIGRIRALPIFLQVFSQPILTPEDFHGWTEKKSPVTFQTSMTLGSTSVLLEFQGVEVAILSICPNSDGFWDPLISLDC